MSRLNNTQLATWKAFTKHSLICSFIVFAGVNPLDAEELEHFDSALLKSKTYLLDLPVETYQNLSSTFSNIYNKTIFTTEITSSAFKSTPLYDVIALPLLAIPSETVHVEVFGQRYDKRNAAFSQMSQSQAMYEFYSQNKLINLQKNDVAVGLGMSYAIDGNVQLKTLYSTGQIPGYGDSQFSLGIEVEY